MVREENSSVQKINLQCNAKLWYNKIVVNDVVKLKNTTEETLMVTRKELVDNIITWDILVKFLTLNAKPRKYCN